MSAAQPHTMTARRLQRFLRSALAPFLCCLIAAALIGVFARLSGHAASGVRFLRIPRLPGSELMRRLALAIVLDLGLLASSWRRRFWRRTGYAFLACCSLLALVIVTRRAAPVWAVADGALIELYTIYATQGQQLLGAYSQYAWNHPGPFMFYTLAPFYLLGSKWPVSLDAGALAINLASLLAIGWVLWRHRHREGCSALAGILTAVTLVYLWRVPNLLTSAWNPHLIVLPLMALVAVASGVAAGDVRLLPLSVVLGSFVSQTHVGGVPVAVVVVIAAVLMARVGIDDRERRRAPSGAVHLSAWLLLAAWALPLAEQLSDTPGNMTRLWRFFCCEDRPGQPLMTAYHTWAGMLFGFARPDFYLAQGWALTVSPSRIVDLLPVLEVAALVSVVMGRPWPASRRIYRAFGGVCLAATVVALWSATRISGAMPDYGVFWISVLGVVNIAVVLAAVLAVVPGSITHGANRWRWEPAEAEANGSGWAMGAGTVLLIGAALLGMDRLRLSEHRTHETAQSGSAVESFTTQLVAAIDGQRIRKPRIRIDDFDWGVAAGVLLQLRKMNVPYTVDASLVRFFGRPAMAQGDEDALLTFCGPRLHWRLVERPDNVTFAEVGSSFIDGIRLLTENREP